MMEPNQALGLVIAILSAALMIRGGLGEVAKAIREASKR